MPKTASRDFLKRTTAINILLGMWLFLFGAYGNMSSPETWTVGVAGGLIALFAAIRLGRLSRRRTFSFLNMLLGAWVFVSPWVMDYAADGVWLVNSLAAGMAVFAVGYLGARYVAPPRDQPA